MPIGNKKTWDNGIGAGPTNVIFGQQQQQSPWQQQQSPWQQQASQQNNNWAQQPQQTRQATGINRGALNADPNAQQQQQPVQPVQNNIPNAWNTETQGAQWDQNMVDQGFVWTMNGETGKFEWMTPDQIAEAKRKSGYGWQFRRPNGPTGAGGHR